MFLLRECFRDNEQGLGMLSLPEEQMTLVKLLGYS